MSSDSVLTTLNLIFVWRGWSSLLREFIHKISNMHPCDVSFLSVSLSAHITAYKNSRQTGRILMKIDIRCLHKYVFFTFHCLLQKDKSNRPLTRNYVSFGKAFPLWQSRDSHPTYRKENVLGINCRRRGKVTIRGTETNDGYYYWYSALGPVWAETRVQSGDWYGSNMLHPGQVLRGSLPLLSPAF